MPLEKLDNSTNLDTFSPEQKAPEATKPTLIKVSDDLRPTDIDSFEMKPTRSPEIQRSILESGDIEMAMRVSKGDLAYSLSMTRGVSPDQAAKVAKVAGALRLPKDTVERNLLSAEDIIASKDILSSLSEQDKDGNYKYPYTIAWLSNPDKMAQAKDDVNALAEMETLLKRNDQSKDGILKKSARAFAAGSLDLVNTLAKAPGYAEDLYFEGLKARVPVLKNIKSLKAPDFLYDNLLTKWLKDASQDIKPVDVDESAIALIKEGKYSDAVKNVYLNTVLNAPNLLLMLGVSAATSGAAGLAVAGLTEATSSFADDREAGRDRSDAALASVLKGSAEAGFEYVTLGNFKRLFGGLGKKLTKEVGEEAANITLKGAFTELLKDSAEEGASEYLTTITQDLADYFTGKKEALDGTQERALNSLLVGGLSGGIMAGAGIVAQGNAQVIRARQSKEDMDRVNKIVSEGKIKARNEELLGDFVKSVTGENVYVPLEAVATYFQNDPVKIKTFAEALGLTPEELKAAQDTGTDLEISKDKFVSKIMGTDIYDGLKDKVRYGVDGLTFEEATKLEETLKQDVIDAQESFREIREEKRLPDKLVAMKTRLINELGMGAKDADAQLAVLYAGAKTFSAKQGKSVDEYLNDVELQIKPKFEEGGLNQGNVIDTPEFKNFFEGSKVVDKENKPLVVYHGTVTDFNVFDKARANIENDFGKGFYFTNNQNDVDANYSGIGPDMENKIARLAERIESDSDGELTYDQAKEVAKKQLVQNEGKTLEVYLSIKNPAILGGDNPTNFDFKIDEETGEETGTLINFINSLRNVASDFGDVDIDRAIGDMLEQNPDGGNLEDLIASLKKSEGLVYAIDNDTGDLASSEVIRSALEDMGFDGVVDNTVDVKFGSQRRIGKSMAGVDSDTTHYIVFKSEQIKSVDNKGAFNPEDPNIFNQTDPKVAMERLLADVSLEIASKINILDDDITDETALSEYLKTNDIIDDNNENSTGTLSYNDYKLAENKGEEEIINKAEWADNNGKSVLKPKLDILKKDGFKVELHTEFSEAIDSDTNLNDVVVFLNYSYDAPKGFSAKLKEKQIAENNAAKIISNTNELLNSDNYKVNYYTAIKAFEKAGINFRFFNSGFMSSGTYATIDGIKFSGTGSLYIEVYDKSDTDQEGDSVKVRFSDHWNTSSEHARPDFNIVNGSDFKEMLNDVLSRNGVLYQTDPLGFYSKLSVEVEKMDFKAMPAKDLLNRVKKLGLKQDELDYTGIVEFLQANEGKVTKDEVVQFLKNGGVKLTEITKQEANSSPVWYEDFERLDEINFDVEDLTGVWELNNYWQDNGIEYARIEEFNNGESYEVIINGNSYPGGRSQGEAMEAINNIASEKYGVRLKTEQKDMPRYRSYTQPDATQSNYREVLLTLPNKNLAVDNFKSGHFNELNILAHFRLSDHNNSNTLFVEEIQSDWHQAGRDKGYKKSQDFREQLNSPYGVPDAPFKQTEAWAMLAFKRILRMAVEKGYRDIQWTTGEQQAERYDLRKQISEIAYWKDGNKYGISILDSDGSPIDQFNPKEGLTESDLVATVGKDIASKIVHDQGNDTPEESGYLRRNGSLDEGVKVIQGDDLKIGGEGMKGFYDNILPKSVDKYVKKLDKDAKVTRDEYWTLPITEQIKAEVMKGQSLFQTKRGPKGSIQFKEDGKTIISLYENSDFSTLLHESGHLFTNWLKQASETDAQAKADYDTLVNFAGGELNREGHEKIARGFEAYLREGVAPSVALRDAFRRIKTWLVNIYRSLAGLNVSINDEVRAVFDRMLASEAEIAEAEAYRKSKKIAESFFKNAPLTEKQRAKMEALRAEAHEQALEIQTAKVLSTYFKAIGSLSSDPDAKTVTKISEGKNLLKEQAKKDVNEMKVYKIINEAQENKGLSRQEFEAYAGKQTAIEVTRRFPKMLTLDSDVSLDAIAIDNDYESTEAMVKELSAAKAKTEAYDDRYKHLLAVREAQIKDALRASPITFEGEEALYNDAAMEYLVEEAKILAGIRATEKGQKASRYSVKAYKDAAKQAVGMLKVKDAVRFDKYVAKERQFSKDLSKALNANDTEAAQSAKEKQLRNNALVLASVEAKEILDKKLKAMVKIAKAPKGSILGPYHDAILLLLNAHGISDKKPNRPDRVDYEGVIKEIEQGVDPVAIPDIAKNLNTSDYKSMTFEDFEGIAQAVNILAARGRNTIRLNAEGKTMTIGEKVDDCIEPMRDRKNVKELKKSSPFYRIGKMYRGLLAETIHVQFDLKRVDGYEGLGLKNAKQGPNEEMFDLIFRKQKDASQAFVDFNSQHLKSIGEELEAIGKRLNTGKAGIQIPNVIMPPLLVDNGFTGWTPEMIVSVALNAGNEGNLDSLMKGYGMTLQEVKTVIGQLNTTELQTVQKIWDAIDSLFTAMDEVHYRQNGFRLKKVEPKPLEVIDTNGLPVTLKGGYYPIAHDPELSRKVAGYTESDIMKNESLAVHHRSKPRDSMTKERKGSKLPIKLSIQPLYKHIKDTINYTNLAEVLTDVHKVIKSEKYANQYTQLMGKERYDILTPWLSAIARPEAVVDSQVDHWLNRYQRLTAIGALGVSFLSFAKQTTSLVASMRDIKTKHLLYGMGMLAKNPIAAIKDVETRSIFMRDRQSKVQQEIARVLEGIDPFRKKVEIFGKTLSIKDLQEFALVNIRMGDILGSYPAWIGAYSKKINEGLTEVEAVHFADKLISETQPTASALFNNLWQQGGPKASASGRMVRWVVAPFTGWTMKFGSRSRTYWNGWREGKVSNKDFFEHVMYERVLTPALVATMTLLYSGLDDKEPLETYLYEVLGYQLSWIPGINQIPGMVQYGAKGKLMEIPAATSVRLGAKAVISAGKTLQGEQDFIEFVKALGYIAEFETGIPAMKAAKDIKKTSDAIIRMTE